MIGIISIGLSLLAICIGIAAFIYAPIHVQIVKISETKEEETDSLQRRRWENRLERIIMGETMRGRR